MVLEARLPNPAQLPVMVLEARLPNPPQPPVVVWRLGFLIRPSYL